MLKSRSMIAALALVLQPALTMSAEEGGSTDTMRSALAAGWKAAFTCSGLFLAGQTQAELDRNELADIYPDYMHFFDRLPEATIDEARGLVSVAYSADMPPRMAIFRKGYGCIQLPVGAGEEALNFLPRYAAWPEFGSQDRGSAIGSNVRLQLRLEDAERLEMPMAAAFDEMTYGAGTRTSSVVIVRDGQIVAERYARGVEHETPQRTWSVAKSLTATLIGAARRQGLVDLDYPVVIEAWNKGADPRRAITLRHLLHMASGLDAGQNGARTDRIYFGGGRVADQATTRILEAVPGTLFRYSNNDTLVAMRALREAIGNDAVFHRFPYETVLHRIGAVRTTLEIDWNGDFISSSQVWATGRDLARIGQLYLQDGVWAGERILPEGWVDFVRTPAPAQPPGAGIDSALYGGHFWLMSHVPDVPEGTFYAAGNRGQYIVIMPALNTVIVRQGYDVTGGVRFGIDRFVADVTRALVAADADRAAAAEALRADAEEENEGPPARESVPLRGRW